MKVFSKQKEYLYKAHKGFVKQICNSSKYIEYPKSNISDTKNFSSQSGNLVTELERWNVF